VPSDDVDDLRVVKDVYFPSEITSVVENILVDFSTPFLMKSMFLLGVLVTLWKR